MSVSNPLSAKGIDDLAGMSNPCTNEDHNYCSDDTCICECHEHDRATERELEEQAGDDNIIL